MLPIHKTLKYVFDYDSIPAGYYHRVMLEGPKVQRFWHRKKFEAVAVRLPDRGLVVDYGCAAGSFLYILGETKPGLTAIGLDVGSSQIDFARTEIQPHFPDGRIRFETLSDPSGRLPIADASADVVTCIEVVEHLHPALVHRFLAEARRILKPDGKLLLTTPNYRSAWPLVELAVDAIGRVKYRYQHINKFTPNSLVKVIEAAKFHIEEVSTLFVAAPFLAGISEPLAMAAHQLEAATKNRMGQILFVEATVMADRELDFPEPSKP